ncbi:hypothetical protein, partial [Saccharopolyspora sp. NPDC002686]|uniref:hypothetical protein n=1 Tax=Saccharopolyspora sp. NPDC002686 TaxID=3154541 RepID=UPI00331E4638
VGDGFPGDPALSRALGSAGMTLLALPFIVGVVLIVGLPLGLLVEKLCRKLNLGRLGTALTFGVLGLLVGLGPLSLLHPLDPESLLNPLGPLPAVISAPLGRLTADHLVRHRVLFNCATLICTALALLSIAMWQS